MTSEIKFEDFLEAQLKEMEDFLQFAEEIKLSSNGYIPSTGKNYTAILTIKITEEQSCKPQN